MLEKINKPEIIENRKIKLVKIRSRKWNYKCFYCKLYFRFKSSDGGSNVWKQMCKQNIHDACYTESWFIPLKYIRKLKYALVQENKILL
jgi:hypothetical protein